MLEAISIDKFGVLHMDYEGQDILVEAFDKPYVAKQVHIQNNILSVQMPYQLLCDVEIQSLCVDEWDRFQGNTRSGIPFVLSHAAQAELFNLAEEFSDNSIMILGKNIETPPYYVTSEEFNKQAFWSGKYQENPMPPWNLDEPHPELKSFLQQLKLNKSRILVPGCGYGHDAAFLAEKGHIVTAIDLSDEALDEARKKYGHIKTLNFVKADVLNLDESYNQFF